MDLACAKCGATDDVLTYTLSARGLSIPVDLCPRHAEPIEQLMGFGSPDPESPGGSVHSVIPVD